MAFAVCALTAGGGAPERGLLAEDPPPREVPLKILSYNIHGGGEAWPAAMGEFIAGEMPDIVSLQEVPGQAYLDSLLEIVGPKAGLLHATSIQLGKAMISRTPIGKTEVIPLVDGRSLLRISTVFEGMELSVYGVHISWDAEGDAQAHQIVDSVLPRDSNPRKILVGDYNDEHFSTQNSILESALSDAWTDLGVRPGARTSWPSTGWAGTEGNQLIDLLLRDPRGGMFPLSGEILNLDPVLSDHRPVVFTMRLTDPIRISPPQDFAVDAIFDSTTLEVRFDREVGAAASDPARYEITLAAPGLEGAPGPRVLEAQLGVDSRRARLRTEAHEDGRDHVLTIEGMAGRAGTQGMARTSRSYRSLRNLVANPGAEDGTAGWVTSGGLSSLGELRQLRPYSGRAFFGGGAADAISRAEQKIALDAFALEIDEGRATAVLGAYLATGYLSFPGGESRCEPYDDAEVEVSVLDSGGVPILATSSGKRDTLYWYVYREDLPLPPGSRALLVSIEAFRKNLIGGTQNDAAVDDVFAGISVSTRPHGLKSGNLLENPGAEADTLEPWAVSGTVQKLANYTPISTTQAVAASGQALFWARPAKPLSALEQSGGLPAAGKLDFIHWGGTLRTYSSRMESEIRLELLDGAGRVLLTDSTGPRREAEWTLVERWSPIPQGAASWKLTWEARGTDLGAFADGFFARVAGGPPGEGWFSRGDVERDGKLSISDAIEILLWLFLLEPGLEVCLDAADANDDGAVDLSDAIRLLTHLFAGGAPLPPPGLERPGPDPTTDELGCK
jgi:endonuclease/exonuclease/phosphatase family metal-dependent hydrolase